MPGLAHEGRLSYQARGLAVESSVMAPRTITLLAALLAVLAAAPHLSAKPIDLSPKFTAGDETHYVSRSRIRHVVRVDLTGVDETTDVETESGMTLAVMAVDASGVASLEWRLRYVMLTTDGAVPGIDRLLDYDSRDPGAAASPLAPLFAGLIERPVTLRMDRVGTIIDFQGPGSAGLTGPLAGLTRSFFSRQAFEQLPLFVTAQAPIPAPFRSTWTTRTRLDMPLGVGALEMDQRFKFVRISPLRKTASIQMSGTITKASAKAPGGLGSLPLLPGTALAVEDGSVAGQYTWDFEAGRLVAAESTCELKTALDTPVGRMQLEQKMTTFVTSTTLADMDLPPQPVPPKQERDKRPPDHDDRRRRKPPVEPPVEPQPEEPVEPPELVPPPD